MEPNEALKCLTAVKPEALSASDAVARPADDEFLRSVWPGLVRLGHLLSGSRQKGEDLAQEALLGLLRHAPVAEPRAYLRRSMVNLSINDSRRAAVSGSTCAQSSASKPYRRRRSTTSGHWWWRFRRGNAPCWCCATTKTFPRPTSRAC